MIQAVCQICGKKMAATDYTLHIIGRHWAWVEAWHKKVEAEDPDAIRIMYRIP